MTPKKKKNEETKTITVERAVAVLDATGDLWATYGNSLRYVAEDAALRLKGRVVDCTITYEI